MRILLAYSIAVMVVGATYVEAAADQVVVVKGCVYEIAETDGDIGYTGLAGVRIQAYRGSPILDEPVISDTNGNFAFEVRAGEPFLVRFMGAKKVPELQELAGKGMTQNEIHVALVTKEQYETMKRRVPLEGKLKYMLSQLPETDEASGKIRQMLQDRDEPQFLKRDR